MEFHDISLLPNSMCPETGNSPELYPAFMPNSQLNCV